MKTSASTRPPKQYLVALGILATGLFVSAAIVYSHDADSAPPQLASVAAADFERYLAAETPTIIDVRTATEFAAGHLPGAINIDSAAPDFADMLARLNRREEYAIYCRSGNRSGEALALMRSLGFQDVRDLSGGIKHWLVTGRDACTNC